MKSGSVLITGASEGMGREFARIFARNAHSLVLVARNTARLDELAAELRSVHGVTVTVIPKDLSAPDSPEELKFGLDTAGISVEILVNNAGFGIHGPFQETDWKATAAMLELNMVTLTRLTRLFLPDMLRRGSGKILNVASTAAFQPGPFMACYFASKAYVLSLTEAVAEEVRGTGVTVTAFCPGPTRTQFQARSGTEHIRETAFAMDPAKAVQVAYRGLMRGQRLVIPGFLNRLMAFMVRLSPRTIVLRAVRFLER